MVLNALRNLSELIVRSYMENTKVNYVPRLVKKQSATSSIASYKEATKNWAKKIVKQDEKIIIIY